MYDRREVYANAPLTLVVAEVRITYSPRLRQQDTLDKIFIELEDELPVVHKLNQQSMQIGPAGIEQHGEVQPLFKLLNRPATLAATISPTAITLEATEYSEFSNFQELYLRRCRSVARRVGSAAVERVGLRYIDEIRLAKSIRDVRDWRSWVADPLVDVLDVANGGLASTSQGLITYDLGQHRRLNFRYAALHGTGIVGNDLLKRRHVQLEAGPFFVLDMDGYWEGVPADFDVEWIGNTLASVHEPTGDAFQSAITDRSRALFRELS